MPNHTLQVTSIGEYVRVNSCARRLNLSHSRIARNLPFYGRLHNAMDPVLQTAGREREDEFAEYLAELGFREVGVVDETSTWQDFEIAIEESTDQESIFMREVDVEGEIGEFTVNGRIDFLCLDRREDAARIVIVETKASRKDKTYHRIQVASYKLCVQCQTQNSSALVLGNPISEVPIACYTARIDEGNNEIQRVLDYPPLQLVTEPADVEALLSRSGGVLEILESEVETLPFSLDSKCDACTFSVHCFPEAARNRRIELLSIDTGISRIFRENGISTLDELSVLDLTGDLANRIKSAPSFSADLADLRTRAAARLRTLPARNQPQVFSGEDDERILSEIEALFEDREYFSRLLLTDEQWRWTRSIEERRLTNVLDESTKDRLSAIRFPWSSQVDRLPAVSATQIVPKSIDGFPTTQVYLSVHYDYVENRIGAIAAHITSSGGRIVTPFEMRIVDGQERYAPEPIVQEFSVEQPQERIPVVGEDVILYRPAPWPQNATASTATEGALLETFFHELVNAISDSATDGEVALHFYCWSRSEVSQLVEACSRSSPVALASLKELLGCREPLDQLIFTCLQNEVSRRFALGWTGRGLSVISTLRWGRTFHWSRTISGRTVALDRVFDQDIFDFKSTLDVYPDGSWAEQGGEGSSKFLFEIRSRFHDALSAPYWRALWGTLRRPTDPAISSAQERNQMERYYGAATGGRFREFLRARCHCLRWVADHLPENRDIEKPRIEVAQLQQFQLGVRNARDAALDFLRLEQHVRVQDWVSDSLSPPSVRVAAGRTLPVRNLRVVEEDTLEGELDFDRLGIDVAAFQNKSKFEVGAPYRVSRCFPDPSRGQTIPMLLRSGFTGFLEVLDFERRRVRLKCVPSREGTYSLPSFVPRDPFEFGVVDESVTDFVASKVERRLLESSNFPAMRWFDPNNPLIPEYAQADAQIHAQLRIGLETTPNANGDRYDEEQIDSVVHGLGSRIQLLQGPPGTGKTTTSAIAVLVRIVERLEPGDRVVVAGPTHRAVNTLIKRIAKELDSLRSRGIDFLGRNLDDIEVIRVDRRETDEEIGFGARDASSQQAQALEDGAREGSIQILGATTNCLMKLATRARFRNRSPKEIIIDEASMMVFPHFLAIASLASEDTRIMIVGDHRQLAPIVSHDWENEDRPPIVAYQPFVSSFEAVRRLGNHDLVRGNDQMLRWSQLSYTFRLPEEVRRLISPVYERDELLLRGRVDPAMESIVSDNPFAQVWLGPPGIYLLVHSESASTTSNETEIQIIERVMEASEGIETNAVAIVTPHRAQRTALRERLRAHDDKIAVIDTVEKLQGGERPFVMLSATVSDPAVIARRAEFVLSLERANVAFSRCQTKLIVVCSQALLGSIPSDLDDYESSILWKTLREVCSVQISNVAVNNFPVKLLVSVREEV